MLDKFEESILSRANEETSSPSGSLPDLKHMARGRGFGNWTHQGPPPQGFMRNAMGQHRKRSKQAPSYQRRRDQDGLRF
jgi:hypothetical protein